MAAICIETWTRTYTSGNFEVIKSLNKFSDESYTLSFMRKDLTSPYSMWSLPIPEKTTGFIKDRWEKHQVYDQARQEWADVNR